MNQFFKKISTLVLYIPVVILSTSAQWGLPYHTQLRIFVPNHCYDSVHQTEFLLFADSNAAVFSHCQTLFV